MHDFLYAEPLQAMPEPSGVALTGFGLIGVLAVIRRRLQASASLLAFLEGLC